MFLLLLWYLQVPLGLVKERMMVGVEDDAVLPCAVLHDSAWSTASHTNWLCGAT